MSNFASRTTSKKGEVMAIRINASRSNKSKFYLISHFDMPSGVIVAKTVIPLSTNN